MRLNLERRLYSCESERNQKLHDVILTKGSMAHEKNVVLGTWQILRKIHIFCNQFPLLVDNIQLFLRLHADQRIFRPIDELGYHSALFPISYIRKLQ